MRSVISRLIFSKQSIPRLNTMAVSGNGRYMTTDSTKVDESFKVDKTSKVEEAEAVDVPPPPTQKLLVLGGSGFVGSHVCREALDRGLTVASLSRSGRSSIRDSWANHVTWHQGVILRPGFIYGTRSVGSMKIPLGVIGSPLEMVLQHAKPMSQLPLVGPLFISPVNVTAVAQVAVRAATDPVFPPGIIDVPGIQRYSQQKSS
ncbi:uncharacterized protein CFP56_014278 [Quercus suber]|uniref:NAD-dependent epimerase/dehydratase domain-containing protein n=1 Tax=Quercus suber TaxID=58331 RepID=A0AAW0KSI2_QUESU